MTQMVDDWELTATNQSHPDATGQHTNGPATVWVRSGGEWLCTHEKHLHRVRELLLVFGDEYIQELKAKK